MKITEIKKELAQLSLEQLVAQKNEIAKKLFEVKVQIRLGKLRDTALVRKLRKVVARINTYIGAQNNQLSR
jgi:ribosomal protein L29